MVMVMACLAIVHITEGGPKISNVHAETASVEELVQQRLALTALNTLLLFPVRQVLRRGIKFVHEKKSCTEYDLTFSRSTILRLRYQEYQCIRSFRSSDAMLVLVIFVTFIVITLYAAYFALIFGVIMEYNEVVEWLFDVVVYFMVDIFA